MSKSGLIVFAIISVIGVVGGIFLLIDGACSGLDVCVGVRNCPETESCSAAFFSVLLGTLGVGVTVYEIKHMKR